MMVRSELDEWALFAARIRELAEDVQGLPLGHGDGRRYRRALLAATQAALVAAIRSLREGIVAEETDG